MKTAILVAVMGGCSLSMTKLDPQWSGTSEPDCTDSIVMPLGDGLLGAAALGVSMAGALNDRNDVAIAGIVAALPFAIFSLVGEQRYEQCERAYTIWRLENATGR